MREDTNLRQLSIESLVEPLQHAGGGSGAVLVVEDDPVVALCLKRVLTQHGFEVLGPVGSGNEAFRLAEQRPPEVILADIGLPDTDGYGMARILQERTNAPVVLLSGSKDLDRPTRFEPHAFLLKPFDQVELTTAISGALYRFRSEKSLLAAKEELKRSNRELEKFAYVASHDLQEPLRMVSGFLGLLNRRIGDQLGPEAREYIDMAMDGAQRMHRMIGDLLTYSRAGRPGVNPQPTPLAEVMEEVTLNLTAAIEEAGAEVRVGTLPTLDLVRGDCVRLFQNLIGNAIKFRRDGVAAVVEVESQEQKSEWEISVQDNGIGISPEDCRQVFEPFFRVQSDSAPTGTGIGLAVCQRIAASVGGRIKVASAPGQGSLFTVILPKNTLEHFSAHQI